MSNYRVLWIDDQYKDLEGFSRLAVLNGITLIPFQSREEGINYLSANMSRINAVLLDAMAYQKAGQQEGTESRKALYEAWEQITALGSAYQKPLPRFILTGQPSLLQDAGFKEQYEGFFHKGSSEESKRLFVAIKLAIDNLPETQLRSRYAPAFAACTDTTLGESAGRLLVKVLQAVEKPQSNHADDESFNTLRQLVEAFFQALHRHQLLPDQCQETGKFNLTYSRLFLAGEQVNPHNRTPSFKTDQALLPAVLADALQRLIELSNNGSHFQHDAQITPGQRQAAEAKLTQLRQRVKTPYLLASLTYQLLDLLVWLKALLDSSDLATYQNAWKVNPPSSGTGNPTEVAGKIKWITAGGSAYFIADADNAEAYIPKRIVEAQPLTVGQAVRVVLDARPPAPDKSPIVVSLTV